MIFFHPHIGSGYRSASLFPKRILVLGESHYCGDACADCGSQAHPECAGFTQKVVADYLNPANEREGWMNTYLKFERSLVGHETTPAESRRIWDDIAFYNYLQVAVGGPRKAGTAEQYQAAAEPFFSVLNRLQPDLLIVWGKRLWDNLPSERWQDGEAVNVEGYSVQNGYYLLQDGWRVRAFCVYHPSTGYDWAYWHKVIKKVAGDGLAAR